MKTIRCNRCNVIKDEYPQYELATCYDCVDSIMELCTSHNSNDVYCYEILDLTPFGVAFIKEYICCISPPDESYSYNFELTVHSNTMKGKRKWRIHLVENVGTASTGVKYKHIPNYNFDEVTHTSKKKAIQSAILWVLHKQKQEVLD